MKIKLIELRDRATFIPCIAIELSDPENASEMYLLRRAGYSVASPENGGCVLFGRLDGGKLSYDPYLWDPQTRTMSSAHAYLEQNWSKIKSGDVVDVEYILGETDSPKESEQSEF